jgi:two-component system, OmpR family, response regulator ChvI
MTVASKSSALFSPQSAVPAHKMRVLFVDDDDDCREALSAELGDHGLEVESFRDGRSMLDGLAAKADADVALLDWNLPDIPGIDLALELNRRSVKFPIVFLTGQALGTSHEMLAFERGALDFIDKSRGVPVIVKRLRMIAGPGRARPQREVEPERLICQGRLTLRPKVSRALWDGMDVDLTVTEYRIVELLVAQAGGFFSYRQVYDCMHYTGFLAGCGDDGYRVNVRSAMKRIRNKFRVHTPGFAEIENHPGLGYRWRPRD